jgi:F0F1-type ATP synthase assembly protein I
MGKQTDKRKPDKFKNEKELEKYRKPLEILAEVSAGVLEGAKIGFQFLFTGPPSREWKIEKDARKTL